jgi:hypothetical protein
MHYTISVDVNVTVTMLFFTRWRRSFTLEKAERTGVAIFFSFSVFSLLHCMVKCDNANHENSIFFTSLSCFFLQQKNVSCHSSYLTALRLLSSLFLTLHLDATVAVHNPTVSEL